MKIALTVWGNRISPVFDSAQTLLIVKIKNDTVIKQSFESFNSYSSGLPDNLKNMGVSVLICGAISERPATLIASSGIKLIPFVTGTTAKVLDLYLTNNPVSYSYFMPGYKRHGSRNGLRNAVLTEKQSRRNRPK